MENRCKFCGGNHLPDTASTIVKIKGKTYVKPFYCMCCGKEICARQFAYGRACGLCDTGFCKKIPEFSHSPFKQKLPPDEAYDICKKD